MGTRTNIYGDTMGLPSGKTLDRGITISTKDDRYSLRINKYESNVLNANNTSGLNVWLIGNNGATLFTWGEDYADRLQYDLNEVGNPASTMSHISFRIAGDHERGCAGAWHHATRLP